MKKTLFFLIVLGMLVTTKALAYEWTDGNGVTWKFSQKLFTINGEMQNLWYISGAESYSETVSVPQIVYNGTDAVTIEAIDMAFPNGSNVILPNTIKVIETVLPNYAGTVTIGATIPPAFSQSNAFGTGVTILVPTSCLEAYRTANFWKDIAVRIISQDTQTYFSIETSALPSSSGIQNVLGENNLDNVMSLKVKGSINSYDILIIRNKMHNLHHLDLTEANVIASNYKYYNDYYTEDNIIGDCAFAYMESDKLISVKLPKTIISIGHSCFFRCFSLQNVEFQDGLQEIGIGAFEGCNELKEAVMKYGLKSIGDGAFEYCRALRSVVMPITLREIGSDAFRECYSLKSIVIPEGITIINPRTFADCIALENVWFPTTLLKIGGYAFSNLSGSNPGCPISSLSLPNKLEKIGERAFRNNKALKELHISSSIREIGHEAFDHCDNLKDYYVYTAEPVTITDETFCNWSAATLHIPQFAYNNYYWDTQWSKFAHLIQDDDYRYHFFYLTGDQVINDAISSLTNTPDVDLNAGSGLIVETKGETLQLDEVHMASNATASASIMANNNLTVEKLYFDIEVAKNKWYFLTFPFRVKLSNVTSPGDFVFRYYDGATRAQSGKGGWQNVTTDYLNAGQGYIFQTNTDGTLTLLVEKADMDFSSDGKQDALSTYAAENTANASWNFLGNPHTAYFDINQTGYTAPITVWNGSAYQAIRPGDDTYYMKPFEAFFVQKPSSTSAISFPAAGRYTYKQVQEQKATARAMAHAATNRHIVNLTIATDEGIEADQTRVVYNEEKATAYEIDCDAAKFFSDGQAAQLYTLDANGTQYAINERPLGDVNVGYTAAAKGLLTIAAVRMDRTVLLYDNVTGITHDLSQGGYSFQTEAGTFESRFTLTFDGSTTGLGGVEEMANGKTVNGDYYDLQGRRTDASASLKGVRIVKDGHRVTKIMNK